MEYELDGHRDGIPCCSLGFWLYDGLVVTPVHLVETDYDFWHETTKADGLLETEEAPALNSHGHLYYVCFTDITAPGPLWVDSEGFESADLAALHAESKVPGPITWR